MDVFSPAENKNDTIIEQAFFNKHRSANPTENALVNFVKRKNESLHFVEKTVKQIGYPRWDKILHQKKKNISTSSFGASVQADSSEIYYIPFVRDSQNFVNASMIITANTLDTSFEYKCDWQYSQLENNTNTITDSAEHFAIFFMQLDKVVFGYNEFKIIDTNIFRQQNKIAKKIRLSTPNQAQNNLYSLVTTCQDANVYFQCCPYIQDQGYCYGTAGVCDACPECLQSTCTMTYSYCWSEYVNSGGGETGGGSTGGGGDGSGGTPPNPCNGTPENPAPFAKGNSSNESNVVDPCEGGGGGWVPIEDEPIDNATMVNYLTATLNLSIAEANFLTQHSILTQQIYNCISLNYSDEVKEIGKDHITKLVTDNNYLNFVNGHSATGNNQNVWWLDIH